MLDIQWIITFLILGSFVGFMAGLLGIGGGGIMVPMLTTIFIWQGVDANHVVHLALGTSMASIIFTSFSSMRAHHSKQAVIWPVVNRMTLGILLGTFLATFAASNIPSIYLALFFTAFMAFVSVQMFLNKKPKPSRQLASSAGLFGAGSFIGAISALVSIGGGSLTVPYLTWQNVDIKKAIGTSAAIGLPISIAGTLGYLINGHLNASADAYDQTLYTFGFVNLPAVLLISITSVFMAPIGAKVAHKLPVGVLKKMFAVLLIILSAKMLISVL